MRENWNDIAVEDAELKNLKFFFLGVGLTSVSMQPSISKHPD